MSPSEFNKKRTVIVVCALGGSFLLTLFAVLFLGDQAPPNAQSNSYSKSSLGHELMVETLEELDFDVRINRHNPPGPEVEGQLLVFAEPDLKLLPDRVELEQILRTAGAVLLVLPKRTGEPDPDNADRLESVAPSASAGAVLNRFLPESTVQESKSSEEVSWSENNWNIKPTIEDMNLIVSDDLHPLIATKDGILLGRDLFYHNNLYVLSDPDLLATHGFVKGSNAELVVAILSDILPPDAAIIIDEASHGFVLSDSFWQEMFRYPLNLIVVHGTLIIFVLLWLTSIRLGKKKRSEPPIPPGKKFLLENVVGLMSYYRHDEFMARRYLKNTIRHTAIALRFKGTDKEIEERLATVSRSKSIHYDPGGWRMTLATTKGNRRTQQDKILKVVQQAHKWKKEILDES